MTEKKKPLSLNQRHNLMLHEFSPATGPLPSFSLSPTEQENPPATDLPIQDSKAGEKDDFIFSKISDSDYVPVPEQSSRPNTGLPSQDSLAGKNGDSQSSKFSDSSCLQEQGGPLNMDLPPSQEEPNSGENVEERKPRKTKIIGRRRLCKVSFCDEAIDGNPTVTEISDSVSRVSTSDPTTLFEISHSDSSAAVVKPGLHEPAEEIRNILSDLSAVFEGLSVNRGELSKPSRDAEEKTHRKNVAAVAGNGGSVSSSFRPHLSDPELDDDDDDCTITSIHEFFQNVNAKEDGSKKAMIEEDTVTVDDSSETRDSCSELEFSLALIGPKDTFILPNHIAEMLYSHQRDGLKWLWSLHCHGKGGILGDDMGLGKTMQICGFLAGLFHSKLIRRALIVAPKTLLSHWIKELSAVGLSEKTREYYSTSSKIRLYELQCVLQGKGILLTTYDIVRNNSKSLQGRSDDDDDDDDGLPTWDYMILDEGHLIKNPSTQRAKSLLEIPSNHRIIMSGTPIQNNLKELWALFNFCCPELLGDKKWFKDKYEFPILRGNDKQASDRDKRIGSAVAKELRDHIQPYFLRRMKHEVFHGETATAESGQLSKKNEIIVWLKLTSCQRKLYEAFLKSELVLSSLDTSPLAALTILKKICDHPMLLTKRAAEDVLAEFDRENLGIAGILATHLAGESGATDSVHGNHDVSCKITFILSLLHNLIPDGHKVLIFSQTRKMLNLIQESLVTEGCEFLRIDGTTKAADRVTIVKDFQRGVSGAPVFLLTSQVGGLGLTLTSADRVIVVDPAWNPSTDNQSVDRAYRIGQKKDVVVYRLMTCGTVEEKIYKKQIFKGGLFKSATEHKEHIRYFSQQDLSELFSLPEQGFDVSLTQQQLHEEHDRQHTVDKVLESHINFLGTKGIAGVSHHSLLFSRTTSVKDHDDPEDMRKKVTSGGRHYGEQRYYVEEGNCGSEFAVIPKAVKLQTTTKPDSKSPPLLSTSEIKDNIHRLTRLLQNKVMVARLPDGGRRIELQIAQLKQDLEQAKSGGDLPTRPAVIDLDDDVASEFQRKLNV